MSSPLNDVFTMTMHHRPAWRQTVVRRGASLLLVALSPLAAFGQSRLAPASGTAAATNHSVSPTISAPRMKLSYPPTRRGAQTDNFHNVPVADPYRWLEELDSPETRQWVEAQNKLTNSVLEKIPARQTYRDRLTKLWNYERFGLPSKRGSRYFYSRNDGLQNQNAVFVAESLAGQPRLLLDPNTLSADGTIALANWVVSDDGKLFAYALTAAGSDWNEWRVLEVDTGRQLPDQLHWVKFSRVSWTPDNRGFYYSRYDEPLKDAKYTGANYYQKLCYHRLGDPQSKDVVVYQRKDQREWGFDGEVTEDGHYLIISVWRGTERKNQIFYQDLRQPGSAVVELIAGFDAEYQFLGNDGGLFWLMTDKDAPLRKVIAVDTKTPAPASWQEIIPPAQHVLDSVRLIGNHFVAEYLQDAKSAVHVFDLAGKEVRAVDLPGLGSAGGFGGRRDDGETFYSYTDFITPGAIYRYDVATGKSDLFRSPQVDFDPSAFTSEQIFYTSRDGARVPMFLVYKKGLVRQGNNPTILYGYGGFNISSTPGFSASTAAWLEQGGVYAVANLRGGGEYGRAWHEAGMRDKKQNVFDDFIAAAEWLIANKYTSASKLAIRGGSNGGLLVGAAMTQRPELFAAAVPAVGVLDMLRFHRFTIGWAWVNEFGSADDPAQFKTLLAYSPLHNLKPGARYPATLIVTGDHDDRVVPGHSYKFAAALQAAQAGDAPTLIRIETRAGHGAGKPTAKLIEESADVLAFLTAIIGPSM